ncbi:hypothetical protein VTK26DRAFT_3138 [Humicola hyalothermophila]
MGWRFATGDNAAPGLESGPPQCSGRAHIAPPFLREGFVLMEHKVSSCQNFQSFNVAQKARLTFGLLAAIFVNLPSPESQLDQNPTFGAQHIPNPTLSCCECAKNGRQDDEDPVDKQWVSVYIRHSSNCIPVHPSPFRTLLLHICMARSQSILLSSCHGLNYQGVPSSPSLSYFPVD